MEIPDSKKSRAILKNFFVKNAIPTQSNFSDLIEGGINQQDDGLVKSRGAPLSIEAGGDDASEKPVLSLYRNFSDENPAYVLSLNPFSTPGDQTTAKAGFSIGDGTGNSQFFIDPDSRNLGIDTIEPQEKLHVYNGNIEISGGSRRKLKIISDTVGAGIDLVVRNGGHPYIDFTHGEYDDPDFGVRLIGMDNESLKIEGGSVDIPGGIPQEDWVYPELKNGWTYYDEWDSVYARCSYFKDTLGVVHIRGQIKKRGKLTEKEVIFNLPTGYRPEKQEQFPVFTTGTRAARIDVRSNGDVVSFSSSGYKPNNPHLTLFGITFRAV